jgi:Glycosyl transferase family 2
MSPPRLLGVLLCYNDGDILAEAIEYLRSQNHELVVWDHGSTDETPDVLARYGTELLEHRTIPRTFDFYELYPAMSRHLLEQYVPRFDWISWPDQDEFLEGPSRSRPYADWLIEACESTWDWIQFNNFNFWFTDADDPAEARATERIRHYALFPDCAPRIRSWRASATNIREFNHNAPMGVASPVRFNLRHYPMRSAAQAQRRLEQDRAGIARGGHNFHYDQMMQDHQLLQIAPSQLLLDDGVRELDASLVFNWRKIYGYGPALPANRIRP